MVYTTIYRVSTIQGGAGFLPSTLGEAHRRFINPFFKNSLSVALWLQDIFPSTLGSLSTAEKHLTLAPLGNDRIFAIYLPFMVFSMFFFLCFSCRFFILGQDSEGLNILRISNISSSYTGFFGRSNVQVSALPCGRWFSGTAVHISPWINGTEWMLRIPGEREFPHVWKHKLRLLSSSPSPT